MTIAGGFEYAGLVKKYFSKAGHAFDLATPGSNGSTLKVKIYIEGPTERRVRLKKSHSCHYNPSHVPRLRSESYSIKPCRQMFMGLVAPVSDLMAVILRCFFKVKTS